MSDLTRPSQASYLAEAQRLLAAITAATTDEDRAHAEHEMSYFMRLHAVGRSQEWFDRRKEEAE